jgi:hypothetical protein
MIEMMLANNDRAGQPSKPVGWDEQKIRKAKLI